MYSTDVRAHVIRSRRTFGVHVKCPSPVSLKEKRHDVGGQEESLSLRETPLQARNRCNSGARGRRPPLHAAKIRKDRQAERQDLMGNGNGHNTRRSNPFPAKNRITYSLPLSALLLLTPTRTPKDSAQLRHPETNVGADVTPSDKAGICVSLGVPVSRGESSSGGGNVASSWALPLLLSLLHLILVYCLFLSLLSLF